jgi:glutamine transport system substrate-binding protein
MILKKILKCLSIMVLIGLISVFALGCSNEEAPGTSDQDNEEKPTYIVAFEATFPPFESKDEETGEFIGFDIDLIRAIGEVEGFDVELMEMGFDGIVAAVQTGNVDLGVSGLTIDEDRLESVDFSTPYYHSALGIVVRADNDTIKGVDDLKGKKLEWITFCWIPVCSTWPALAGQGQRSNSSKTHMKVTLWAALRQTPSTLGRTLKG